MISKGIGALFGGGFGGGSSSAIPWSEDIFRAGGGPVSGGKPYIVGEKRPELFVPSQSGTILPHVPSGGNGSSVETTTIHMGDTNIKVQGSADKQTLTQMKMMLDQRDRQNIEELPRRMVEAKRNRKLGGAFR